MSRRIVVGFVILAVAVILLPQQVTAQGNCEVVVVEDAQTVAESEFSFVGSVEMTIGVHQLTMETWVLIIGGVGEDDDGTQHAVTSHEFTDPSGASFTTFDETTLSPTTDPGVMTLSEVLTITTGSRRYSSVEGRIVATGEIDFTQVPPVATWNAFGKICGLSR